MKKAFFIAFSVSAMFLSGCTGIPASSPMSKLHRGMTRGDVIGVLNAPTEIKQSSTWRNYLLPWKTINDYQTVYYYNGLGQINFNRTGKQTVQSIEYNPNESGIAPYNGN
ncbi:MAG TPA: hypothetical protein QF753_17235 [Victivallales bacterium]|jgi:hypothetical protein|nr:hypothetical protein [Victivallales bacterium]